MREKWAIKFRSSPRPGVVSKVAASHLIKTAPGVVFLFAKPKTLKLPQLDFSSARRSQRDLTLECIALRASLCRLRLECTSAVSPLPVQRGLLRRRT